MPSRRSSTSPVLVSLVLLAGLLAGCGGGNGEGESEGGSRQGGGDGQQGGPETNIAIGTISRINPENDRRIVVRANQGGEEKAEPMTFKIRENAEISLDSKQAEVGDIAEGQQVQVEYLVREEMNRALSLQLFKTGGQSGGQPSGGEGTSN